MGSKNEHQMLGFKIMYNNNNSNKKAFWYWLSLESCLNKIYLEDDRPIAIQRTVSNGLSQSMFQNSIEIVWILFRTNCVCSCIYRTYISESTCILHLLLNNRTHFLRKNSRRKQVIGTQVYCILSLSLNKYFSSSQLSLISISILFRG